MRVIIFYSWQSDLPNKYNRSFIEDCINEAIKGLNKSDIYDLEIRLDKDTQGATGTPDIANTIFHKIRHSHIFIGDISIINPSSLTRKCPNPNVLLEMGHASATLGWENVIAIFNNALNKVEELPFDLRLRRPLSYTLGEDNLEQKSSQRAKLINAIKMAIISMHPDTLEEKRRIEKEFLFETRQAREFAIERPPYWEIKLTEEILRDKLSDVGKRHRQYKLGLLYGKSQNLDTEEFLTYCQTAPQYLISLVQTLLNSFNKEFPESQGPPGMAGDPIKIKDFASRVAKIANDMLDWEIEAASLMVPVKCKDLHDTICGVSEGMFCEILTLPDRLKKTFDNDFKEKGEIRVNLVFESNKKLNELVERIKYYSNNPTELFD